MIPVPRGSILMGFALVVSSLAVGTASYANPSDDPTRAFLVWFPECFDDGYSIPGAVQCIRESIVAECFGDGVSPIEEIQQCVVGKVELPSFLQWEDTDGDGIPDIDSITVNTDELSTSQADGSIQESIRSFLESVKMAVSECMAPYKDCIETTLKEVAATMEPCVNETLANFAACARENAEECKQSCSADDLPEEAIFQNLDKSALVSCSSIQESIMDPTCDVIDCCAPCVDEYEAIASCVVVDVLGYPETKINGNSPCVECTNRRRRRRRQLVSTTGQRQTTPALREEAKRLLEGEAANLIYDQCSTLTPGLTNTSDASTQLAGRATFFECVTDTFYEEVETYTAPESGGTAAVAFTSFGVTMFFALLL
jgi:hypothetical protein